MIKFAASLSALFLATALTAQSPTPAPAQEGAILILGATAHVGNGTVINNCALAFENGRITLIGDATTMRFDRTKFAKIYDASGKQVYPGFIAMDTQLGLVEVDAVRATVDKAEVGDVNPNSRAIIAYNTDSEVTPTVRSNGVLLAQISPEGGRISGSSTAVRLDAWNWEDAAIRLDEGMHLNWPDSRPATRGGRGNRGQESGDPYGKALTELNDWFGEAKAYSGINKPEVSNPRFEAMRALFAGKQTLYIHVNDAKGIRDAVFFAKKQGVKMAVTGGNDAWQEISLLKENDVPVVLSRTHREPSREDEDYDQPYKTAKMLQEAGIRIAFSDVNAWQQRNLPFQAGQAVGAGLPYEAAIQAVTLNAATMLGIADNYGSLESGKSATLFISEGDALDMRTNQVTAAFIDGREINLDNKQKALERRYSEKYSPGKVAPKKQN